MNIIKTLVPVLLLAVGLGCGYSKPAMTTATMPAIAQLNPTSATAGGLQFQLEVDGTNFASNAVINFNGAAQATTVVSAAKLQAMIPATAIMTSGAVPITVTNPGSSGIYGTNSVTSTAMSFTIN